jgi:hypothetical protein
LDIEALKMEEYKDAESIFAMITENISVEVEKCQNPNTM